MIPLPYNVLLHNAGERCDMAEGPCACGAWHTLDERRPIFRVGDVVKSGPTHNLDSGDIETEFGGVIESINYESPFPFTIRWPDGVEFGTLRGLLRDNPNGPKRSSPTPSKESP